MALSPAGQPLGFAMRGGGREARGGNRAAGLLALGAAVSCKTWRGG